MRQSLSFGVTQHRQEASENEITKFQSLEVGVDMLTPLQFTDKYIDAKGVFFFFDGSKEEDPHCKFLKLYLSCILEKV
jgi:hypothetical protein